MEPAQTTKAGWPWWSWVIILLFPIPFSPWWLGIYLFCGIHSLARFVETGFKVANTGRSELRQG